MSFTCSSSILKVLLDAFVQFTCLVAVITFFFFFFFLCQEESKEFTSSRVLLFLKSKHKVYPPSRFSNFCRVPKFLGINHTITLQRHEWNVLQMKIRGIPTLKYGKDTDKDNKTAGEQREH